MNIEAREQEIHRSIAFFFGRANGTPTHKHQVVNASQRRLPVEQQIIEVFGHH
jgi:hypothetical protein